MTTLHMSTEKICLSNCHVPNNIMLSDMNTEHVLKKKAHEEFMAVHWCSDRIKADVNTNLIPK